MNTSTRKIDLFSHQYVRAWRDAKSGNYYFQINFDNETNGNEMRSMAIIVSPVKDQGATLIKLALLPTESYIKKKRGIEEVQREIVEMVEPPDKHGVEQLPQTHPLYDKTTKGKWCVVTSAIDVKDMEEDIVPTMCKIFSIPDEVSELASSIVQHAKLGDLHNYGTIKTLEYKSINLLPNAILTNRGASSAIQ